MKFGDTGQFEPEHLKKWWEITCGYLSVETQSAPDPIDPPASAASVSIRRPDVRGGANLPQWDTSSAQEEWPALRVDSHGGRIRFISRVRGGLLRRAKSATPLGQDSWAELQRAFYLQLWFIARHPDVAKRLLGWLLQNGDERIRRRVRSVIEHYTSRVAGIIADAKRQELVKADVDPYTAARYFVGLIQALALKIDNGPRRPEPLMREAVKVFDIFRAGLTSPAK